MATLAGILFLLLVVAVIACGAIAYFYTKNLTDLKRFESIEDVEAYTASCQQKAASSLAKSQQLDKQYRTDYANYQSLQQHISNSQRLYGAFTKASDLDALIQQKNHELNEISQTLGNIRDAAEIAAKVQYYENHLHELQKNIAQVEESNDLQEFGYYKPKYDFESSEQYKIRLDQIKDQQKRMLKEKSACKCVTEWTVEGSKAKGAKMVGEQVKLMLRAFNGESDAAISKVKFNNAVTLENRLNKSFEAINKLGKTKQIYLDVEYLNLKLQELFLNHEYKVAKEEEREAQAEIRTQMREEEKAQKEIEKAKKDAEREEKVKLNALDEARRQLAEQEGANTLKMQELVAKLENELKDAIDRKAKAIARAQLTRSGHVYILSNVGAFGEGVYKIGLTRRLEPLDRVKELGSASVPFPFDVHAMIYSEDAPQLETALHRHFAHCRVNMVNQRKEFFHTSIDDIRQAVASLHANVTFVTAAEAAQYRETVALKKSAPVIEMQTA